MLSPNHYCRGKVINIRYSECVSVALFVQHAKRMRHTILSSAAFLAVQYFRTLSHKRHHFRENFLNIKFVFGFSLQLLSEIFFFLGRIQRDIIIDVHTSIFFRQIF